MTRRQRDEVTEQAHQEFVAALLAEIPEMQADVETCDGLLEQELEAFSEFTQAAKLNGDLATYERCLKLMDQQYAKADGVMAGAFKVSYLEHLEFEGSRGPAAWQLVPPRLQAVCKQITAENRRLMALPQKSGLAARQDRGERGGDRGGDRGGRADRGGRRRTPRRGRRR